MKQLTILSGRCLVVEMPEGASGLTYPKIGMADLYFQKEGNHTPEESYISVPLPPGNWRIIGMLSEVTEEHLDGLVECEDITYAGLGEEVAKYPNHCGGPSFDTRLESLSTAIAAEGYTFSPVIPWLDKPESEIRALESRVLSRERCLLLGREG